MIIGKWKDMSPREREDSILKNKGKSGEEKMKGEQSRWRGPDLNC